MSNYFNTFKLVDGYALNNADGYSYTTNWVDLHSVLNYSATVVFTGGSPVGTITLQQSNDREFSGNRPVAPKFSQGEQNSTGTTTQVDDSATVPAGTGQNTAAVNGAGKYALNQYLVSYRWFRVVYTASSNANTQLDIFVNFK